MTAPNIVNVTSITGRTKTQEVTTSVATLLTCATNHAYKIGSIIVANKLGSNQTCSLIYNDGTARYIAFDNVVPSGGSLIIIGKDYGVYLEEGDSLQVSGSANSALDVTVSYEDIVS